MYFNTQERAHLFNITKKYSFSQSHAQVPFIFSLDNKLRVFYGTRDDQGKTRPTFFDLDLTGEKVLYQHNTPIMELGNRGTFDEDGVMPSCFIKKDNKILMYYTGWNRSESAAYRLSIGLAESYDDGATFHRCFQGPILDRNKSDLIWVGQPHVQKYGDLFQMWYLSCDEIRDIEGRPEPMYRIKYAESIDGIDWKRDGKVAIDYNHDDTFSIGRPCVFKHKELYYMLHSNRHIKDYRSEPLSGYRLVLSSSKDGKSWITINDPIIDKPESGWDSTMNEYASVFQLSPNNYLVLHNGNGFGETGIGRFELAFYE